MIQYKTKTGIIDAWKFGTSVEQKLFFEWLKNNYTLGEDFDYVISSRGEIQHLKIKTIYGCIFLKENDIIVVFRDGQMSIYCEEEFNKIFEPIPDEEDKEDK